MSNYEFPPIGGGAGRANLNLLKEFSRCDEISIDLVTSAPQRGFVVEQFAPNITIHKVGVKKKNLHFWKRSEVLEWLVKAGVRYRNLLGRNTYDLAHAFFAFPTGWLCYNSRPPIPYILSLRGSDVPGYSTRLGMDYKLFSPVFRRIWKSASAVIANSRGLADLAKQFVGDIDIGVIYNGVDSVGFSASSEGKPADPVRLLTVSRLIKRKRIDLLIEATGLLKQWGIQVRLNIAGDGNLGDELQTLVEKLNLGEEVNFLGLVEAEDMPAVYRANDIFVMSSVHEGMSNAMLEAMASGLPIVTTRCEGVDELISENGIVVDGFDAESIARALRRPIENRQLYRNMSASSRQMAHTFTWHQVARQYMDLYRRIAVSGGGGGMTE